VVIEWLPAFAPAAHYVGRKLRKAYLHVYLVVMKWPFVPAPACWPHRKVARCKRVAPLLLYVVAMGFLTESAEE